MARNTSIAENRLRRSLSTVCPLLGALLLARRCRPAVVFPFPRRLGGIFSSSDEQILTK
jgi:hypothetical protein